MTIDIDSLRFLLDSVKSMEWIGFAKLGILGLMVLIFIHFYRKISKKESTVINNYYFYDKDQRKK